MINKSAYLEKISSVREIMTRHNLNDVIAADAEQLEYRIDDYAFRVVVVGGFSSGKSAMLNRLLETELLAEAQGPETAIATEISYAPIESACAVYPDGRTEQVDHNTATQNPPTKAAYLSLRLRSSFLKQRQDLVLVDFPGFDSNIEAHNNAIASYIHRGSAFLMLIPARNGTLQQSEIKFLKEIAYYPQSLGCLLSKVDLVDSETLEEVEPFIKKAISDIYGAAIPFGTISIKDEYNSEFVTNIGKIIDNFNPQELFDLSLSIPINAMLHNAINSMQTAIEAADLDTSEIELRITECEKRRNALQRELEREKADLDRKYEHELIPDIISRARNALFANSNALAEAALSNQANFSDLVQGMIRPILNDVPELLNASFRNIVGNVSIAVAEGDSNRADNIKQSLLDAINVITNLPQLQGKGQDKQPGKGKTPEKSGGGEALGGLLSMGAGLGVAMKVINPIVGVIMSIAPALVNVFSAIFGKSNSGQQTALEQARGQIESQVIPDILERLQTLIAPAMRETRDNMIHEITAKMNEAIAAEETTLSNARQEIEQRREEYLARTGAMKDDLARLENMLIAGDK